MRAMRAVEFSGYKGLKVVDLARPTVSDGKTRLPAEVAIDAEVDLCGSVGEYVLQARLNVSLPGVEREVAEALVKAAHQTCPYSPQVHTALMRGTNDETFR
jgi:organic hydroperoxide reductase OsmC/OhrA